MAYCHDCGAAWLSPAEFARNDDYEIGSRECPQGVEMPSFEDVAASVWAGVVLKFIPEAEYSTAAEINREFDREREPAEAGPGRRPARWWTPVATFFRTVVWVLRFDIR